MDNQTIAEQKASAEKRRIAAEGLRAARQKAQEEASENEDTSVLDNLLEKLRSGENVGRRTRRARPTAAASKLIVDTTPSFGMEDPAGAARDLLARLQSDGLTAFPQTTPKSNPYSTSRRNRRRLVGLGVTPESPNEPDSGAYDDSVTLVDQSNADFSRTNSHDAGDDDSAGDVTVRVDSS
jgi:cytokinesis protein